MGFAITLLSILGEGAVHNVFREGVGKRRDSGKLIGMTEPQPHPPRRSLLAVWRWPRWVWVAIIVMGPIGYILSPPFVGLMFEGMGNPDWASPAFVVYYWPIQTVNEAFPEAVNAFYHRECETIDWLFGTHLVTPEPVLWDEVIEAF